MFLYLLQSILPSFKVIICREKKLQQFLYHLVLGSIFCFLAMSENAHAFSSALLVIK